MNSLSSYLSKFVDLVNMDFPSLTRRHSLSWPMFHHGLSTIFLPSFYTGINEQLANGVFTLLLSLVKDAQLHQIRVLPVCINHSEYDHSLTAAGELRLGLRQVKGFVRGRCTQTCYKSTFIRLYAALINTAMWIISGRYCSACQCECTH